MKFYRIKTFISSIQAGSYVELVYEHDRQINIEQVSDLVGLSEIVVAGRPEQLRKYGTITMANGDKFKVFEEEFLNFKKFLENY